MSRFVRASKFRHVFGDPVKKDECWDNVPITRSAWDSNFCSVNEKFVAVVVEASGGGAFMVLTQNHTGKIDADAPRVVGHKSAVNDVAWNPFNANMVASASDDCTVKIWLIPDGGLKENMDKAALTLEGHSKKVGNLYWHPSAADLLFTTSNDNTVRVWNIATGECVNVINGHTDTIYTLSFNADGSKFVTTCKDKKLRIFDAHTGNIEKEVEGHTGTKASRAVWLTDKNMILTTGFSRQSDRQFKLYSSDLAQLKEENIDTSSGTLMPFYDADLAILYLAGKGDGNVRYYEITDQKPHVFSLSEYKSNEPQRGMGWLPKRAVDISKCEIARLYKLMPKGIVEPIRMIVPRKADTFQEDIYPDCESDVPALSAAEWLGGANAAPKRISLRDGFKPSEAKEYVAPPAHAPRAHSVSAAAHAAANAVEEETHKVVEKAGPAVTHAVEKVENGVGHVEEKVAPVVTHAAEKVEAGVSHAAEKVSNADAHAWLEKEIKALKDTMAAQQEHLHKLEAELAKLRP